MASHNQKVMLHLISVAIPKELIQEELKSINNLIQEELKSINKRQPAFYNKIIQVSGVLFNGWYTPSTPIFEVIHPPCNAIFKS